MGKPVSGFIWIIRLLCLSLVLGFPGCSFHNTKITSRLNFLEKEENFFQKNIGLIGGISLVQEDITLTQGDAPSANSGILHQIAQGAWDGALSGLEAGQFFCWSGSGNGKRTLHISGKYGGADALIFLILCGGGMVTGMSIGATVGMVEPLVPSMHPTEIPIARKHVVQGVWKELISTKEKESSQLDRASESSSGTLSSKGITFGSRVQPFTAFIRLENIHVGLFSKSYFDAGALTLIWNIQATFFDDRRRVVAKQIIEMEQGERDFDEWADEEALLLKKKLQEGYRLIAGEIVGKIHQASFKP